MVELDTMFQFASFQSNTAYKELGLTLPNYRNPTCGDKLSMSIGVYEYKDNIFIDKILSDQEACIVTRSSLGYLQEVFPHSSVEAIKALSEQEYLDMVPFVFTSARSNCVLLPFRALQILLKSLPTNLKKDMEK